ncbi:50S ribosomal protein L12P [Candidatus Nitrosocosmicus oleophilus]|jgi:large subunit ribosomal protein L12|uniref:Large ribosomal subunit protein P1 n=2 Tax=Candidatus Nitrosocosmicus oleophilus TaxID=1353260 RepID=A0A654M0B4_9ARCH|nr:50S ribosomal protein L12P [Candidatus Nitrosocosmicus oleophilus]
MFMRLHVVHEFYKVLYYGLVKFSFIMEYVYAALLLHKLKQDVNEDNVKNVIKSTGVEPDEVRVKSLVAALSEVNIEDALKAAPIAAAAPASAQATPAASGSGAPAKEEEKKDEKKEEEALEGLSSLFG